MDHKASTACCMWASDEEIEQEPDAFNCDTCPVAAALEDLEPENAEAWRIFHRVVTQLAVDVPGIGPLVLEKLAGDRSEEDFEDLVERLAHIYRALYPPKTEDH